MPLADEIVAAVALGDHCVDLLLQVCGVWDELERAAGRVSVGDAGANDHDTIGRDIAEEAAASFDGASSPCLVQ
jgi:hypothetical protein